MSKNTSPTRVSLSVLMIGNSFSICTGHYLPQVVASLPGKHLTLTSLYIGGCTLEQHCDNLEETEADPEYAPYKVNVWDSDKGLIREGMSNIQRELNKNLDIVTLQQASPSSWNPATYQPYLGTLIHAVRQKATKAEILLQQTWAYRTSSPYIAPQNPIWGFGQDEMYSRLSAAYNEVAQRYGLRMIPTGAAVQETRSGKKRDYPNSETINQLGYEWPDLPPFSGDVVGSLFWHKNENGKLEIGADDIHLNVRGEYLQACLWAAALFDIRTVQITFVPDELDNADAAFLRVCAQRALDKYLQR